MDDEPRSSGGWLPPSAPGGGPPPRFDAPPAAPEAPRWDPPASSPATPPASPASPSSRPTFVASKPAPRNARAVWALVLGIAGLLLLLVSLGTLFPVALPCSAGAWWLAARAQATPGGEGQITAALWLGRIGVLAGVIAAVVLIVLLASGFDFEQLREDLERELDERRRERS